MNDDAILWACPQCHAKANEHGAEEQAKKHCRQGNACLGFICECDTVNPETHGEAYETPCPNAVCYHCEWSGTFPKPPGKILAWEKKALDAGWTPPKGWKKT